MGIWVASTFWLLWIEPVWTFVYTHLFKYLFAIHLGVYTELGLGDHVLILFLIFE